MQIDVAGNVSNLTSINCNFVCKHAWSWNFYGICPVVVIVTEGICKVENSILWNIRSILRNIKVGRFYCSLSNRMRDQEEVKFSINYFTLFNKSCINICTLSWISYSSISTVLEKSLSNSFIYNDQCYFW
jgi:hypothetical protein